MSENNNSVKETKKKSFFSRWFEKMDKKIEEKAKSTDCCCKPKDKGSSCCS